MSRINWLPIPKPSNGRVFSEKFCYVNVVKGVWRLPTDLLFNKQRNALKLRQTNYFISNLKQAFAILDRFGVFASLCVGDLSFKACLYHPPSKYSMRLLAPLTPPNIESESTKTGCYKMLMSIFIGNYFVGYIPQLVFKPSFSDPDFGASPNGFGCKSLPSTQFSFSTACSSPPSAILCTPIAQSFAIPPQCLYCCECPADFPAYYPIGPPVPSGVGGCVGIHPDAGAHCCQYQVKSG